MKLFMQLFLAASVTIVDQQPLRWKLDDFSSSGNPDKILHFRVSVTVMAEIPFNEAID